MSIRGLKSSFRKGVKSLVHWHGAKEQEINEEVGATKSRLWGHLVPNLLINRIDIMVHNSDFLTQAIN